MIDEDFIGSLSDRVCWSGQLRGGRLRPRSGCLLPRLGGDPPGHASCQASGLVRTGLRLPAGVVSIADLREQGRRI